MSESSPQSVAERAVESLVHEAQSVFRFNVIDPSDGQPVSQDGLGSVCLRRLWLAFRRNNKRAQVLFHRNESVGSQALDSARASGWRGWTHRLVDFEGASHRAWYSVLYEQDLSLPRLRERGRCCRDHLFERRLPG